MGKGRIERAYNAGDVPCRRDSPNCYFLIIRMNNNNGFSGPIIGNDLFNSLQKLVAVIYEELDDAIGSGALCRTEFPIKRIRVMDFDYEKNNLRSTEEEAHEEMWDSNGIERFLKERIQSKKIYSTCANLLPKEPPINPVGNRPSLELLVLHITHDYKQRLAPDKIVSLFLQAIGSDPIPSRVVSKVFNVYLAREQLDIGENIIIRRPKRSDFEYESRNGWAASQFIYPELPGAYLEVPCCIQYLSNPNVESLVEKHLDTLRLFRPCSIWTNEYIIKPKSLLHRPYTRFSLNRYARFRKLELNDFDANILRSSFNQIQSLLPSDPKLIEAESEISTLDLALGRYKDALLQTTLIEGRIALSVSSLEALLLLPNEKYELSRRLSQRVGHLLALLGKPALEISKNVRSGYDIRSKYVHGQPLKVSKEKGIDELADQIFDYTRITLAIYISLKHEITKKELIVLLDEAMLENKSHYKLSAILEKAKLPFNLFPGQ